MINYATATAKQNYHGRTCRRLLPDWSPNPVAVLPDNYSAHGLVILRKKPKSWRTETPLAAMGPKKHGVPLWRTAPVKKKAGCRQ